MIENARPTVEYDELNMSKETIMLSVIINLFFVAEEIGIKGKRQKVKKHHHLSIDDSLSHPCR